jgi:magnesium-protoporphyrin IX monomethyl ester (oxidative) cyclase
MIKSLETPEPQLLKPGIKAPVQETLLTPRFYTTDFEAVANLDISANETELRAIVEELRADYNRHHFVRDEEFKQSWDHVTGEKRRAFIDFLERSCTSEFSGFLLFKELSRRLKDSNPLLADAFNFMARDEARHAGFLNKSMADLNLSLDLSYLTKHRTYTFFPPEWIIYTVYLSEKIGYWRYILVHRHMQANPEYQFYPLFRKFESWCQDENRHGDFFKALLRCLTTSRKASTQPQLWNNWTARLWVRFFLVTVFATHTMTVFERVTFYESIGIHPRKYNNKVIQETNNTSARAFPLILNTNHPEFFWRLEQCSENNLKLTAISQSKRSKMMKLFQKIPPFMAIVWHMLRLYLIKPIDAESIRETVR